MSLHLGKIISEMGLFAQVIAAFLALLAVGGFAVFLERLFFLGRERRRSREFARAAGPLLDARNHAALGKLADEKGAGLFARLVGQALTVYERGRARPGSPVSPVELVRRELDRQKETTDQEIRRGMSLLATVGSIAPFVGLLGTVVGIITAFQGIAKAGSGGLGAVSSGIAEALVETAFGLLVAIPAVLAFNYLSGKADALQTSIDRARGELVDALEVATPAVALVHDADAPRREVAGAA